MTTRSNSFAVHERGDASSRAARTIERDIRRHAERRRTAVLAVSLAAAGTLLLVSGLSVAIAHGSRSAQAESTSTPATVQTPARPPVVTKSQPAASAAKTAPVAAAKPSKTAVPMPSATPAKKSANTGAPAEKSVKPKPKAQPGVVARKCGRCHSEAQISSGLDLESATSSVDGMIAGKYIALTPPERAAVIAALTRK